MLGPKEVKWVVGWLLASYWVVIGCYWLLVVELVKYS